MAAMNVINNPIFDKIFDQNGGSSSSFPPHSPPLPNHNPPSQQFPHNKLATDEEGFQEVSYRKKFTRPFPVQARRPSEFGRHSRKSNVPLPKDFQPGHMNQRTADPRTATRNYQDSNGSNQNRYMKQRTADSRTAASNDSQNQNRTGKASTWAELIKKGGMASDFDLQFVAPLSINQKKIIVMKEEVSKRTECKWEFSVIAYIVGERPPYHHFKAFISRSWNPTGNFEIFTRNNGFFIIRFSNSSDCDKTIMGGPYFVNGKLIILKKWNKTLKLDRDLLSTIPVWIRLPELSLRLWDKEAFSAIASVVGIPIKLDEHTANETRLSFARILVEIRADADLPNEAFITMHDGENIVQKIEYEWLPPRCNSCACFGHQLENCVAGKVWEEKRNADNVTVQKEQVINNSDLQTEKTPFTGYNPSNNADNADTTSNIAEMANNVEGMVTKETQNKNGQAVAVNDMQNNTEQTFSDIECANSDKNSQIPNTDNNIERVECRASLPKDNPSLFSQNDQMNIDKVLSFSEKLFSKGIPTELPECTDPSQLANHLAPQPGNTISKQTLQKAARLVASSSPPTHKKKKRKSRHKNLIDIMNAENSEGEDEFKKKYITKNKAWDNLKIRNSKSYKKKSRNLTRWEEESSYSDEL